MEKITLDDIYELLDGVHKYSGYLMCICPFHDDTNPSCRVTERGYWCMSCSAHGSLPYLYSHLFGKPMGPKAKRKWNPAARIWNTWLDRFGTVQKVTELAHNQLKENKIFQVYLERRKISTEINKLYLGYLDGYYIFPIKNQIGEIKGAVARASPSIQTKENRYTVSPDCEIKLYVPNWDKVKDTKNIFVCFGTLDSVSLDIAGYPSMTGLSGQELNSDNLTMRKLHYLITDRGEERKGLKLSSRMGWRMKLLRLDYPDDCKDIQDIHVKCGIEKLKELIDKEI